MQKNLVDISVAGEQLKNNVLPQIEFSVGRFSSKNEGDVAFAKTYLNMASDQDSDGLYVKLSGCRVAEGKRFDFKPNWNRISFPLRLRAEDSGQWSQLLLLQDFITETIRSWGGDFAKVEIKPLFKTDVPQQQVTLYVKWPALYDEHGDLVGKTLECKIDGVMGEMNAFKFDRMALPATFDMYALLRVWIMRSNDGKITAGLYLEPKSFDCHRDPVYIPQAKIPPGVPMPPKEISKPHPYAHKK